MPLGEQEIPPKASVLVESLRDIGYSWHTAVSDVIDNSLTAGTRTIELHAETHAEDPAIGILDDGTGMTEAEPPRSHAAQQQESPRTPDRHGSWSIQSRAQDGVVLAVSAIDRGDSQGRCDVLRGLGPGYGRGTRQVDCRAAR